MLIGERYRVLERLGTGGMATVLLAEDERLGRRVALKRLHLGSGPEVGERFKREAKLGASLSHPNVVGVYDVVTHEDQVVLVMEYVEGRTLAQLLEEGALSPSEVLDLLRPLAEALDHAHRQGVVHRDVKPANILVRNDGTVKLADLGIATGVELTSVTATGTALGTASYMAPEQFEGRRATSAADVYALAAVAFEMLSGRKARTGATPMEVVHRIATEGAPDLQEAWPEAPDETVDVLCRALSSDPDQRPQSAGELVGDLERTLAPALPKPRKVEETQEVEVPRDTAIPTAELAPTSPIEATSDRATEPEPEPAAPETPPPTRGPRPRGSRRGAAVAALIALLAVVIAVVILTRPDGNPGSAAKDSGQPAQARPAASAQPAPARVTRAFYERAAADDYAGAWKLAGPGFRSQLNGYDAFRAQFSTLQSVRFDRLTTTAQAGNRATVAIATKATHTNRVDTCSGNVSLARAGAARPWLIERIGVGC